MLHSIEQHFDESSERRNRRTSERVELDALETAADEIRFSALNPTVDRRGRPLPQFLYDRNPLPLPDREFVLRLYPHRYVKQREPHRSEYLGKRFGFLRYQLATGFYLLESFFRIIVSPLAIIVLGLSMLSTWICFVYNLDVDLPVSLLSVAIIFPISFTIGYANTRRERALLDIASLKADIIGLYVLLKDWDEERTIYSEKYRNVIRLLVRDMEKYFKHKGGRQNLYRIYQSFHRIAHIIDCISKDDKFISQNVPRAFQYQRFMIHDFERIRVNHDFRTASSLRSYTQIFLVLYPVLFGPLFARIGVADGFWAGIYVSIVSTFVFVYLFGVANALEDPLAEGFVDHINANVLEEVNQHMF